MVISLELQTCFASSFIQCFDTAVITKTGTIESHFGNSGLQCLFGNSLAYQRGSRDVAAALSCQFLANIRETDAICEVVRFFSDPDVVHVAGRVNPASDVDTIKTELILADMGTIEKAMPRLEKEAKRDKSLGLRLETAKKVYEGLNEGNRALTLGLTEEEAKSIYDLHLLTMKPMLYIANVDEDAMNDELPEIDGCTPVPISAKIEADLAELDPEEAAEYLEALGLEESGLARLIREAYKLLGLHSFFTSGETETRAWTVPIGAKAPQAAGVIHSDFERGFIKAITASFEDYSELDGEAGCKAAGKLRQEGKEYVVQDGDVMHFMFNV